MRKNEQGFVSIVVTLIIMIILSLVTLGFARLMSREQEQALDRQLSSQAFYAAETGVNNAREQLASNPSYTVTTCTPDDIDTRGPVRNTCTTVSPIVTSLEYKPVSTDQNSPKIITLRGVDSGGSPAAIGTLNIRWNAAPGNAGASAFRTNNELTPQGSWNTRTGMLKVVLIPFVNGDSRASLSNRTMTLFLIPRASGGTSSVAFGTYAGNESNALLGVTCNAGTGFCTLSVTGIPAYSEFRAVITSLYQNNEVLLTSPVIYGFRDEQAIVDATGKAGELLRRVQVRVPLNNSGGDLVGNAVQVSNTICKKLFVNETSTADSVCGL